jgi:ribonucleoside-diphosphate reductase beta chain
VPPPSDVAPVTSARVADVNDEIRLNDPQTLYRLWEEQQWSPFAIDLTSDREQWEQMGDADRGVLYWVLSSLMVAEERITTKFSGLVGAHGSEEEASFLATQQVDEARHMQFYKRVQDEVVASPAAIGAHVVRAREQLSPAFGAIFDVALVQAHERLVASPADLDAKVAFVTIYHLILEATLGLTSFRFVTGYLEREDLLPGFVAGYSKIHHDETRHIGYGIWFLRETVRERPETADVVRATLRELLPSVAAALTPPDHDGDTDWDALGAGADEIRSFALDGLTRRLDIVGVPLASL